MKPRITCIEDLDDTKLFPIIGKIRLGVKTKNSQGVEHPSDLDYFRIISSSEAVVKKFREVYGDRPKSLRIACVSEDVNEIFPNAYMWYAGSQLKCHGDNRIAERRWIDVEPEIQKQLGGKHEPYDKVRIPCPCPRKGDACTMKGRFIFMLPEIHPAAAFALNTGSIINLKEIRGTLRSYKDLFGRLSLVPLTLQREARRIPFKGKSKVHHLLRLSFDGDWNTIQQIRASVGLPPLPFAFPIPSQQTASPHNGSDALRPPTGSHDTPTATDASAPSTPSKGAPEVTHPSPSASAAPEATAAPVSPKSDAPPPADTGTAAAPQPSSIQTPPPIPLAQVRSASAAPVPPPTNGAATARSVEAPAPAADEKAQPPAPAPREVIHQRSPLPPNQRITIPGGTPRPAASTNTAAKTERVAPPPANAFPAPAPSARTTGATPGGNGTASKATAAPASSAPAPSGTARPVKSSGNPGNPPRCNCGKTVTPAIANYSRKFFNQVICMPCQKKRLGSVTTGAR